MKKILFPLLLACCSALNAAEDCSRSADACSAGKKTIVSPFLAASAQPRKAAPAPVAKKAAAVLPAPQAVAVSSSPAAAAAPVQAPAPVLPPAKTTSSPLWLLLVGAGLVGLYFYLGGKNRKGKKK